MANDIQQGKILGEFAAKQGAKTVAIIDDRTAYGQGLPTSSRRRPRPPDWKVVATEYTNDKATDFKAILTKIKSTKADLVFYGGMDAQGGPMAKQMKELGLKAKVPRWRRRGTPEFMKLAARLPKATTARCRAYRWRRWRRVRSSRTKFTKKFNAEIQLYAPNV